MLEAAQAFANKPVNLLEGAKEDGWTQDLLTVAVHARSGDRFKNHITPTLSDVMVSWSGGNVIDGHWLVMLDSVFGWHWMVSIWSLESF